MQVESMAETGIPRDIRRARREGATPVTRVKTIELVDEYETNRWYGITALALIVGGIGVVLTSPALLLAAAMAVWYALYYRIVPEPSPSLSLTRRVDPTQPTPEDSVRVSLTIENTGATTVFDLRIIDGVPPSLTVDEGSPRLATSLRPGEQASLSYTVTAIRGNHRFEPATLFVRDIAGRDERRYEADTEASVLCEPEPTPLPTMALRQLTSGVTGRIETDEGGSGVEFHAVREYRPGDSLNRIDWSRKARTGELATIEFRRERMANVILVIDTRPSTLVGPPGQDRPAVDLCIDDAASLFFSLLDAGDRVGVTTLGDESLWLPPGIGADHRAMGRMLFGSHPRLGSHKPTDTVSVAWAGWDLDHRISEDAQLVFLTPLVDDSAERYAIRFEARGHLVTIVSPDPTGAESPGQQLARMERTFRIRRLRDRGIRVVDKAWDESLAKAIEHASLRWST